MCPCCVLALTRGSQASDTAPPSFVSLLLGSMDKPASVEKYEQEDIKQTARSMYNGSCARIQVTTSHDA